MGPESSTSSFHDSCMESRPSYSGTNWNGSGRSPFYSRFLQPMISTDQIQAKFSSITSSSSAQNRALVPSGHESSAIHSCSILPIHPDARQPGHRSIVSFTARTNRSIWTHHSLTSSSPPSISIRKQICADVADLPFHQPTQPYI